MPPKVGSAVTPFRRKEEPVTPEKGRKRALSVAPVELSTPSDWLATNADSLQIAERLIAERLAKPRPGGEHTNVQLCNEVMAVMRAGLSGVAGIVGSPQSSSILILGPSGSGKCHAVEWCLGRLKEENKSLVVLRALGGLYSNEAECIRHLAAQAARQLVAEPQANATFEQCMEWLRTVLRESFSHASAVVIVLNHFEHFCSKVRQTLLYNLFELAQEVGVPMSIVGTSQKMDVMTSLEKRISSRFSMRHLHASLPQSIQAMVKVLKCKLSLPESSDLPKQFQDEFHSLLERSLWSLVKRNEDAVDLNRSPKWFLNKCTPLVRLLRDELCEETCKKQRLLASSTTEEEVRLLLLKGLSEDEHVLLLTMLQLKGSRVPRTLARALHEIQTLHHGTNLLESFNSDRYCSAFNELLQLQLLELERGGLPLSRLYVPCESLVDLCYEEFVQDVSALNPSGSWNPLRQLPLPIQQWVKRRKAGNSK